MNVLIIDQDRVGLDIAIRAAEAGHKVRLAVQPGVLDGKGFPDIEIITDWRGSMKWARQGLILPTCNSKYLVELDRWRDFGAPVFGPSAKSAQLEINRGLGMEVLKAHEIECAPYHTFKTLKEAEAFAWKAKEPYVFKTLGDEEDKALSFVPCDPAQLVGFLQDLQRNRKNLKGPFMLQEKVTGVEIGVAAFIGPQGFQSGKWELSFEHKKLMPGNFGPNTGEMGTVVQVVDKDPLGDLLMKLEGYLMGAGHRGDVAINFIVDEKTGKPMPLEFTCRAGWPDFFIRTALTQGDPVQWMRDLLDGKDTQKVSRDCHIGIVCAQPPFPYDKGMQPDCIGRPVMHVEEHWDQVHPAQMMMGTGPVWDGKSTKEKPQFKTSGPYVMCVVGHGTTIRAAHKDVFKAVEEIDFPNMIARSDVGLCLENKLPKLHGFGIAKGVNF
jgi:phosphoribosylamine--glycine ligase